MGLPSTVTIEDVVLSGAHVRLEPLAHTHIPALLAAAGRDPALYRWSAVPVSAVDMTHYVDQALEGRAAGTALAFATRRRADAAVIGATRFFDIERWAWPAGHPQAARPGPDACEIGYTWLAADAVRTPANTESKLLMLTHAFETWNVHRVCFHTDVRNERSRAALARLGAQFEGVLRGHRVATDLTPRDSARYSIIAAQWPVVKRHLQGLLAR
jgi:N-acetyltransferase